MSGDRGMRDLGFLWAVSGRSFVAIPLSGVFFREALRKHTFCLGGGLPRRIYIIVWKLPKAFDLLVVYCFGAYHDLLSRGCILLPRSPFVMFETTILCVA